jgi:hypothetical protein
MLKLHILRVFYRSGVKGSQILKHETGMETSD